MPTRVMADAARHCLTSAVIDRDPVQLAAAIETAKAAGLDASAIRPAEAALTEVSRRRAAVDRLDAASQHRRIPVLEAAIKASKAERHLEGVRSFDPDHSLWWWPPRPRELPALDAAIDCASSVLRELRGRKDAICNLRAAIREERHARVSSSCGVDRLVELRGRGGLRASRLDELRNARAALKPQAGAGRVELALQRQAASVVERVERVELAVEALWRAVTLREPLALEAAIREAVAANGGSGSLGRELLHAEGVLRKSRSCSRCRPRCRT